MSDKLPMSNLIPDLSKRLDHIRQSTKLMYGGLSTKSTENNTSTESIDTELEKIFDSYFFTEPSIYQTTEKSRKLPTLRNSSVSKSSKNNRSSTPSENSSSNNVTPFMSSEYNTSELTTPKQSTVKSNSKKNPKSLSNRRELFNNLYEDSISVLSTYR